MGYGENITERIIKLTLKILHLLFEEDYIIVKMSGGQLRVNRYSYGLQDWSSTQSPNRESPSYFIKPEVLKVTNKIIELLTGEVPIRCQDVSVYFSMEEWEYIEGHKDLYKDVMMGDHQTLTSPDPRSMGSTCQSTMSSRYSMDEDYEVVITATNYSSGDDQMTNYAKMSTLYEGENLPHLEKQATPNSMHGTSRSSKNVSMGKINPVLVDHTYALTYMKEKALVQKLGYLPDFGRYSSPGDTQYSAGDKKEDSVLHEEEHLPHSNISCSVDSAEYVTVGIKEHPFICKEEEHLPQDNFYTLEEFYQDSSTLIKVETIPSQELPPNSSTYTAPMQYNFVHIKEEPMSAEEEVPAEIELYVDGTHCPSDQPKKPGKSKQTHSKERPFSCNVCGKRFKQKSGLGMHRKTHVKVERYTCHDCGKSFLSLEKLEAHQKFHTDVKPYSCGECGKRFSKATNLTNHQRIHATKNPFSCAKCGKQFVSNSNLLRHQKKHDNDLEATEIASSENGKGLTDKHEQYPASGEPYPCNECGRRFIKRINLLKHQRFHTKKNLHHCQECGKYFMSRAYLLRHMKGHNKKMRSSSCTLCGKHFHSKLDLTIHQRVHKVERPGNASEWRKSFIRKLGFVIQERSNLGEKPYLCSECGERFEKKLQLLRHEKTHNEEKPFIGGIAVRNSTAQFDTK